jgi:GTP-binding protein HflX
LTDTVGFIRDLPPHLIASFHATLAETQSANILLHVVDSSSPAAAQHIETVRKVLSDLECDGKESWLCFNKCDATDPDRMVEARDIQRRLAGRERCFLVSGRTGEGMDALRDALRERLEARDRYVETIVPHARADVLTFLRQNARIHWSSYLPEGVHVRAALSPARLGKLHAIFPEGFPELSAGDHLDLLGG